MSITAERRTALIGEYANRAGGYRQPGGAGRLAVRADRQPDRAPEDPRQGFPLAPRPADAGRPPPAAARLPEGEESTPLREPDRPAEPAPLTAVRCRWIAPIWDTAAPTPGPWWDGATPRGPAMPPPNAASRGGPTDRRSGDPRCGISRRRFRPHGPRLRPRSLPQTQPAPFHATRDAASRPAGRPGSVRHCRPPMPRI